MPQYRKRPVVIEAVQWSGSNVDEVLAFIFTRGSARRGLGKEINCLFIDTLEGTMRADPKDWIIKGVKGEFYPCKPDIFAATYEPVSEALDYEYVDGQAVAISAGPPKASEPAKPPVQEPTAGHEPYFIEVEANGCPQCGHERLWRIVGPDPEEMAGSTTYGNSEEAADIAEMLNDAFYKGKSAGSPDWRELCERLYFDAKHLHDQDGCNDSTCPTSKLLAEVEAACAKEKRWL